MIKAMTLFGLSALITISVASVLALHVEGFMAHGFTLRPNQLSFPEILLPLDIIKEHRGISLGLMVAAGLGVAIHLLVFERLIVKRWKWVSEEQYRRIMGGK
jgi:hypothetical protein